MKRSNKKGFTIVELVIVIAVIAILASVLIPTIAGLVRDANISADTVLAKELNRVLAEEDAKDDASNSDFEAVLKTLRKRGYYIANLNTRADECYFVWDKTAKQIILVDGRENYKVLYSNKEVSEKSNWYFAISDPILAAEVEDAGYNVKNTVATMDDLKTVMSIGGTQTIYLDESIVLDNNNALNIEGADTDLTINLGSSSLNTNGIIENTYPIYVDAGKLTIKGGIIGAEGSSINVDGNVFTTPILTNLGSYTKIEGTLFNVNKGGSLYFAGEADLVDVVIKSNGYGVQSTMSGDVTLTNCDIKAKSAAIWACNLDYDANGNIAHVGNAIITVESGTYEGGDSTYGVIVSCGGDLLIKGGTFISNGTALVSFVDTTGTVVIEGGTFNLDPSEYVDLANYNVTENNGKWTVTAK